MGVHVTFVRSCDLDEWTTEQLLLMKLSGNGNAKDFFKKHGVTEAQMASEKKYSTKAAQEYRRHIARLIQEQQHAGAAGPHSPSREAIHGGGGAAGEPPAWSPSTGLDSLIQSMSQQNLSSLGGSTPPSVPVTTPSPRVEKPVEAPPAPQPVSDGLDEVPDEDREEAAELREALATAASNAVVQAKAPAATGTLKITLGGAADGADAAATAGAKPKPGGMMRKPMSSASAARRPVAKKLTSEGSGAGAVTLESFEATERRLERAAAASSSAPATAAAGSGPATAATAGSSRIAAAYSEAVAPEAPSIYRSAPAPAPGSLGTKTAGSSAASGKASTPSGGLSAAESRLARDKYAGSKSISSDDFFGSSAEEAAQRERLGKLTALRGAAGISSDMLRGDGAGGGADDEDDGLAIDIAAVGRWTSDLIKRIG